MLSPEDIKENKTTCFQSVMPYTYTYMCVYMYTLYTYMYIICYHVYNNSKYMGTHRFK